MSLPKPLTVSASQVGTLRLCKRKWWLEKVAGQPTQDKGYFDFGTVVHAVCERYLGADDRGIDPATGEPVNLYPEGWHIAPDTGVAMDADQQALIRKLIGEAIERGILHRQPGREVEAAFTRPLLGPGGALHDADGQPVQITGFIDYLLPDQVQDHKTVGSWRYAKSGEALQSDAQMLIYAWELTNRLRERGLPVPEKILVRHNQFGKDPLAPRLATATGWVTQVDIAAEMARVAQDAQTMLQVRQIESWTDVPESSKQDACRKFGGCDFQRICLGELDLPQHYDLTIRLNRDRLASRTSHQHGDSTVMGHALTQLLETRAAAAAGGAIPPASGPAPELNSGLTEVQKAAIAATPVGQTITVAPALPQETAPWYDEGCPACSNNAQRGVKSNGKVACMICDGNRRKKGLSTSADYLTEPSDVAGRLKWTELKTMGTKLPAAAVGEPAVAAPIVVRETKSVANLPVANLPVANLPVAAIPAAVAVAAPALGIESPVIPPELETEAEDDESQPELQTAPRKVGRPRKGITLLIRCRRTSSGVKPFLLSKVIHDAIDMIEKDPANGGKSFWAQDTWKRRDTLNSFVRGFAAANMGAEIVCDCLRLPEAVAFLDLLRGCPEVSDVIEGFVE